MSKIISGLVGEKCKIQMEENFLGIGTESIVDVLDTDDEWIKISFVDKKGNTRVQILRIETIKNIELVSE